MLLKTAWTGFPPGSPLREALGSRTTQHSEPSAQQALGARGDPGKGNYGKVIDGSLTPPTLGSWPHCVTSCPGPSRGENGERPLSLAGLLGGSRAVSKSTRSKHSRNAERSLVETEKAASRLSAIAEGDTAGATLEPSWALALTQIPAALTS